MGLGNIDWTIRSNPLILPAIVVVLPPILLGCPFEGHGKTTTVKEQQIHYQEVLRKVFEHIFLPPNPLFNAGKLTLSADGQMRQCFPVICAWMADYFENIHLDPFKQPHCPVWEAPQSSFGQGNSLSWQLRDWAILPNNNTCHSGRCDRETWRRTISARLRGSNLRSRLLDDEMHLPDNNYGTRYPSNPLARYA